MSIYVCNIYIYICMCMFILMFVLIYLTFSNSDWRTIKYKRKLIKNYERSILVFLNKRCFRKGNRQICVSLS